MSERRYPWTCEISGPVGFSDLPDGADFPMREAVREAFRQVTGVESDYLSSGWGRAARPADSAEALLREALERLLAECEAKFWRDDNEALNNARAALAAPQTRQPAESVDRSKARYPYTAAERQSMWPAAEGSKPLDVERLARLAYADRPPLGARPVPWPPRLRKAWEAWARRIAAAYASQTSEKETS